MPLGATASMFSLLAAALTAGARGMLKHLPDGHASRGFCPFATEFQHRAVFDGVGKDTFEKGLNVLAPRGFMVLFGGASGPAPPLDPLLLSTKGSLFLTRPSLAHYTATPEELKARAGAVLGMITEDKLKLRIERTYPLEEAARAHRELEGRKTSGKLLLIP
jgi:NADPH2:quinone reductase